MRRTPNRQCPPMNNNDWVDNQRQRSIAASGQEMEHQRRPMEANDSLPEFVRQQQTQHDPVRSHASAASSQLLFKEEVYQVVGSAIDVLKGLGHGLHEKPYENALVVEFGLRG